MTRFYLLILLSLYFTNSYSQIGWQKGYGDTTADKGKVIVQLVDGRFCIIGSTYFHSTDSTEIAIFILDQIGDLTNASTINLPGNDIAMSAVEGADSTILITGYTNASPLDSVFTDIFVIKVDNYFGFQIWSHFYGGTNDDKGLAIAMTPDSNYLIAGSTRSFGPFNQSALAMKINNDGDMLWCKITGIGVETEYNSIAISADTNYILCGTESDGNGSDHYITKMSGNGTIAWTNQIGTTSNETTYSIASSSDSGFVVAGKWVDPGVADEQQLITKLDKSGNFQWAKTYSSIRGEVLTGILQNDAGKLVTTGYTNTDTLGLTINNLTITEYDSAGTTIWSNVYGLEGFECEGFSIVQTQDGSYAAAGTSFGTGDVVGDAYMVKTDTAGVSGCDERPFKFVEAPLTMNLINAGFEDVINPDTILSATNSNTYNAQFVEMCVWDHIRKTNPVNDITLYPNPATDVVNIESKFENRIATIYDRIGQCVKTITLTGNKTQLNTSDLAAGIYFVRISSLSEFSVLKFIKR
jgi:hypothetical protein